MVRDYSVVPLKQTNLLAPDSGRNPVSSRLSFLTDQARWGSRDSFSWAIGLRKSSDSYQGTTSVVPQIAENVFGFSRWILSDDDE
jgi:hypothetical protein